MKVILEDKEDLEKFALIRDSLLFNPDYKNFGHVCEICGWIHNFLK